MHSSPAAIAFPICILPHSVTRWAPPLSGALMSSDNLYSAVLNRETKAVKALLAQEGHSADYLGEMLHLAAQEGATDIGILLIQAGARVDCPKAPDNPRTPFHTAVSGKKVKFIQMLIDKGADINAMRREDHAIYDAVELPGDDAVKLIQLMFDRGLDISKLPRGAFKILSHATLRGSPQTVDLLLQRGLNPNGTVDYDNPLMDFMGIQAKHFGRNPDCLKLLLLAGADPNRIVNSIGNELQNISPLGLAKHKKDRVAVKLFEDALAGKLTNPLAAASASTELAAPAAAKPPAPPVKEIWASIKKKIKAADKFANFSRAAAKKDIEKIQSSTGLPLPADFLDSLKTIDGHDGLIPADLARAGTTFDLLPAGAVNYHWNSLKSLADAGEFKDRDPACEKGILPQWWAPGWIPIASDGGGDFLCLDLTPAPGGSHGQIITLNHEHGKREILAPCFTDFLQKISDSQ